MSQNSNQTPEHNLNLIIAVLSLIISTALNLPSFWSSIKKDIYPNFQQIKIEEKLPANQKI
jgi:hypothetical protein